MRGFAFRVSDKDNVATALADISVGQTITIRGDGEIERVVAKNDIPLGHKVAIVRIRTGEDIIKFGLPMGRATKDIEAGVWVHTDNMASKIDIEPKQRNGAQTIKDR